MNDNFKGADTATYIDENYDPWMVSAWYWTGCNDKNGKNQGRDINSYINDYGFGEDIFLITQYFVNGSLNKENILISKTIYQTSAGGRPILSVKIIQNSLHKAGHTARQLAGKTA